MCGYSKNGSGKAWSILELGVAPVSPNPSQAWMDPEQESRARCWGRAALREQKGEERVGQELSDGALMGGRCRPVRASMDDADTLQSSP